MILSSADILKILGGNEIIRLSAKLSIADGRPALSGREGIYIFVERFPSVQEFKLPGPFIDDEDVDLVVAEIRRLLPKVQVEQGLRLSSRLQTFAQRTLRSLQRRLRPGGT